MSRLPRTVDDLRGLRAALWVRESTPGQFDTFGPEAQMQQQDEALRRYGLVDTGISWSVAHSGYRKDRSGLAALASADQWQDMLARAGHDYDVLVVGYVSRWIRDTEVQFTARRMFHQAGAAILFADDGILTSDEDAWERWAREAVEAEAYSRRLGKRIREGYAAKRRREGVPGGSRPPFGLRREGRRPVRLVRDPETFPILERVYELSASGLTDRMVAETVGLRLTHVHEILTNPVYAGRLHRGEAVLDGPFIDPATWDRVQVLRSAYSRRHRGPTIARRYALATLLRCAACGRRLTGHSGRYRHVDACAAFVDARPRVRRAGRWAPNGRIRGESYVTDAYERPLRDLLGRAALAAVVITETMGLRDAPAGPDPFTLARIARDRESATARYLRDRDVSALTETIAALDEEEERARQVERSGLTTGEVRAYLEDLPRLWDDTDAEGRAALSQGIFERLDVLGVERVAVHLTPTAEAYGFANLFAKGPVMCSISRCGRGERI